MNKQVAVSSVVGGAASSVIEGVKSLQCLKKAAVWCCISSHFVRMCVCVTEEVKMQINKAGANVCWKTSQQNCWYQQNVTIHWSGIHRGARKKGNPNPACLFPQACVTQFDWELIHQCMLPMRRNLCCSADYNGTVLKSITLIVPVSLYSSLPNCKS